MTNKRQSFQVSLIPESILPGMLISLKGEGIIMQVKSVEKISDLLFKVDWVRVIEGIVYKIEKRQFTISNDFYCNIHNHFELIRAENINPGDAILLGRYEFIEVVKDVRKGKGVKPGKVKEIRLTYKSQYKHPDVLLPNTQVFRVILEESLVDDDNISPDTSPIQLELDLGV